MKYFFNPHPLMIIFVYLDAYIMHMLLKEEDKFGERSKRCIFVGYPHGKKGWKVYDIESGEIFVSRDAIFHEDV